jgi:hypothetical protein
MGILIDRQRFSCSKNIKRAKFACFLEKFAVFLDRQESIPDIKKPQKMRYK